MIISLLSDSFLSVFKSVIVKKVSDLNFTMPRTSRMSDRQRRQLNTNAHRTARAAVAQAPPPIQIHVPVPDSSSENSHLVSYSHQMITAARKFDEKIRKLEIRSCVNCFKAIPELKLDRNNRCAACAKDPNKYTSQNKMNPGVVPPELQDLTYIEQMLIAQIHPVISLYRIRGAQYSYIGNVINFRQDISSYTTVLPHDPHALMTTIVFQKQTLRGVLEFRARADKLRNALLWLKSNNIYYRHITISERNLNAIPTDGDMSQLLYSLDINPDIDPSNTEIDDSYVPLIDALDQEHHLARRLNLPYPDLDRSPVNEFTEEGYIAKAFPCLFPTGDADYLQSRTTSLTHDEYFKFLMAYPDRRFASDPRFRFFAMNTVMRRQALMTSGIFIRRSNLSTSNIEEVRQRMMTDPNFSKRIMVYSNHLRSTKPYWGARCSELLTMVEQLGCPSVFFTLSAADYHWCDLFRLLSPDSDPETISDGDRRRLMHENPLIVSWFFQHRCYVFLECILKPVLGVEDFWFRFEWQHRGSPHLHGVLWLKDCPLPDVETLTEEHKVAIVDYFKNMCVAINPISPDNLPESHPSRKTFTDIPERERLEDLGHLINRFQRHTQCGRHCLRESGRDRRLKCRFDFPKPLQENPSISSPNNYPQFIPARNDGFVNRFNPFVTQIWRANTDFTPIVSTTAVLNYIAKYASKGEKSSSSYIEVMNSILSSLSPDSPAKSLIQKVMISTLGERNYSAQEVTHIIMGYPLHRASRTFVTLTIKDDDWSNIVMDQTEETISVRESLIDKYKVRPARFEEINLLTFTKKYYKAAGRIVERRKDAIVRVFPKINLSSDPEQGEKFFKLQCILYIPFRGEFESILASCQVSTWQEAYEHQSIAVIENLDFPEPEDEGFLPERINEDDIRDPFMIAAGLRGEVIDHVLGRRAVDLAYDWNAMPSYIPDYGAVQEFLRGYKLNYSRPDESDNIPMVSFSADQQIVLGIVDNQIRKARGLRVRCPKRVAVQGKAGSGKSTIIKEIVRRVSSSLGIEAIRVCAPTGAAAINIEGSTIHSLLHLPLCANRFRSLNGEARTKYQSELRTLKFIIIDEMSMIGARMLYMIERRLREIQPEVNEPFGGIFVYLFGDFRQLPPVKNAALYSSTFFDTMSQQGRLFFNEFEAFIELNCSHRQSTSDASFRNLLENLASGNFSAEDHALLATRSQFLLSSSELDSFKSAVELFPTNEQVRMSNERYLESLGQPVANIASENTPDIAPTVNDDAQVGLAAKLKLSNNSRVMLRTNLWVEGGLVNGSLGTVRYIVYAPDTRPPSLPLYLLVEFDNYRRPYVYENLFPIVPIVRSWNDKGITRTRKQFPLTLAYAMTIHKSQGLTLPKIKIDIGAKELAIGLTYVALSRVRELSDIVFVKSYNKDRYDAICKSKAHTDRQKFLRKWYGNN